jgi:hypothetical protein
VLRGRADVQATASTWLWVLDGGLIGMYLVVFCLDAFSRLLRPLDEITYGESWLLDGARRIARGELLYAPADQLPLMHIAYTPVYYALVGWLLKVFGDGGYTAGRALSLGATVVASVALAWSMRRLSGSWAIGLLAVGLFLTQNATLLLWASLHRVDALALAFTLLGLALATAGHVYVAAGMFVLALLTKQTFVAAPVVVCLGLWPRRAAMARFALLFCGACGLAVAVLQWQSNGWFVWHTVTANANQADLDTFATLLGSFLQFNGLPVLAAAATLLLPSACGGKDTGRIWRLYFVGCIVSLATIAKLGASSNYWLELTAATAAMLALGAHKLRRWYASGAGLVAPIIVAGSLMTAVPAYQATTMEIADTLRDAIEAPRPRYISLVADTGTAPYRVDMSLIQQVAREPGELLTDNPGLAVAAGKRIAFEFQIFQLLYVEGYWSEQPVLNAIAGRHFALVALMHPLDGPIDGTRLTPAVRDALRAAYAPAEGESGAGFWLYRPR